MKKIFLDSVTIENALKRLLSSLESNIPKTINPESVNVADSQGRITFEPVYAKYSSPFYHSAAMDGYAVRFSSTFTASETSPAMLKIGQDAIYVDTGDPMPDGFNAVIMVEDVNIVKVDGVECIEIYQPSTPYQHVRVIGEDIVATELIIPENHIIRPVDVGAMLAGGHLCLKVRKKPVVAIIPTGSELIEADAVKDRPPVPPEIIEYNSAVLAGLARECGAETVIFKIVRDNLEDLKAAIRECSERADIVIINAGSGRGSEDFTLPAIQELGNVIVNGVSMKPGKPVIIGFVGDRPVFGIPGYPVSAYLTFQTFVRPVISRLLGTDLPREETIRASISRQIPSSLGVDEFIRVKIGLVGNKYIATPVGRGAGLLMSLVRADGILQIPASSEGLTAGTEVDISLLRNKNEIENTIVCIGSHDNVLDLLANTVKKTSPKFSLSSAHVGSMGGLLSLKRSEAHMAGTHLLDEQTGEYNIPFIKKLFDEHKITLVNLVYRQQGLVVKKGNPKKIRGFEDLLRDDVIFVNRQTGSGTRLLLDKHLRDFEINPLMIKGYDREEYTHMAVASDVLTGLADAGLAIYSSAVALGLDFIPVANERYDLAIPSELMNADMMQLVLKIIRENNEFREAVKRLGGYDVSDMGKVIYPKKAIDV